jgi:lysine/ornithine N-monooxygenase/predicted FMN-binding regulatory protein PaiB
VEVKHEEMLDVLGIGFGPANLAFAIALQEQRQLPRARFVEEREEFGWHPGMMLDGAKVQNSFLKDLVTLRNPRSTFSFLSYLEQRGRLHRFINLRDPLPTRWEFDDYFRWAARRFDHLVDYGWRAIQLAPDAPSDGEIRSLRVTVSNAEGRRRAFRARNVVLATGGRPNVLRGIVPDSALVIHAAHFLERFPSAYSDRSVPATVAVVGAGQSGAEIVHFLLRECPLVTVHWIIPGPAPRPADDTPWINDIFMADEVDRHYAAVDAKGDVDYHRSLRNSNYGVVDTDLLHALYRLEYDGIARGIPRLYMHTRRRLARVVEADRGLCLVMDGEASERAVDFLVLATGYEHDLTPDFAGELLPLLRTDARGRHIVERGYRLASRPELVAAVYVQGLAEHTHGLGDTLFPVMPFRAAEIAAQVASETRRTRQAPYPPTRHQENRVARLYETIRRYPFAMLVSEFEGGVYASHIPLILDEDGGEKGTLFGHLDADNPQSAHLEGRRVLAVFQGPNAYISPHLYTSNQLPTWNFVSVQVRGRARVIDDHDDLVAGLVSIPVHADRRPGAYRLDPCDPRIPQLINGIVGFRMEIEEIEGRFKLSQDRNDADRASAHAELIRTAARDQEVFINWLHDR